ncbi:MAG: cellulase family glycosylhydrolase, partial [Aeromonadaceae bacterium]
LVFSLHAYHDKWNSRAKVESTMDSYQKQSLPLLIGEFGDSEFQADGGHSVDHLQLMASAQQRDLGWIAWSWHGNGSGYQVLDMSSQHAPANLTRRGTDIVYDNAGLPTAQPIR